MIEKLLKASYKGVPFEVQGHGSDGGRSLAKHDIISGEKTIFQDTGRKNRTFKLEAFVAGADWLDKRDALIGVLEEAGGGSLVHPFFGEIDVAGASYSLREGLQDGLGVAYFSLSFQERDAVVSSFSINHKQDILARTNAALSTLRDGMKEKLDYSSLLREQKNKVLRTVNILGDVLEATTFPLNNIQEVKQGIADLQAAGDVLLQVPEQLAARYAQAFDFSGLIASDNNEQKKLLASTLLTIATQSFEDVYADRDAGKQQSAALELLFFAEALAATAEVFPEIDFEVLSEANDVLADFYTTVAQVKYIDSLAYTDWLDVHAALQDYKKNELNHLTILKEVEGKEAHALLHCFEQYGTIDEIETFLDDNNLLDPFAVSGTLKIRTSQV